MRSRESKDSEIVVDSANLTKLTWLKFNILFENMYWTRIIVSGEYYSRLISSVFELEMLIGYRIGPTFTDRNCNYK